MRVLQICLKPPFPAVDGGCMAMNNITQGLIKKGIRVKVLTISTAKHPFLKDQLPQDYVNHTQIEHVFVDTSVKPIDAFCNLFGNKSYNVERFYNKEFEKLILTTLTKNNYDVVLLESLFVCDYIKIIRQHSKAKIIYRAHNVEHKIWDNNAAQIRGFRKNYVKLLAKRLKHYEQTKINEVNAIASITEDDKKDLEKLGCKVPIAVFPFGINTNEYKCDNSSVAKTIFHIGSMDWIPNEEGIKWFLNNVWKKVAINNPDWKLKLAGRKMPNWLLNISKNNIEVPGEVESASNFICENGIMIVPLLSGSGMRIKIIEAMALNKLVIATTIAAKGIKSEHKRNIVIANTAEDFVKEINYYINHESDRHLIAKSGQELVATNYDNQVIVNNLVEFFQEI